MAIEKVQSSLLGIPPPWMSRIVARGGAIGNTAEIRKLLGEPIPRRADPRRLKPEILAMFVPGGVLQRLTKKLGAISKRRAKKIIPAHNTIAAVDEEDNLYVGVEFLELHGQDEALIAGILAHEWGHMVSALPKGVDWSHLTWDELYELRRDEEAGADGFAGRALFLLGFSPDAMTDFLRRLARRKNPKLPSHKYHNTATRVAILTASFEAQERAFKTAQKFFKSARFVNQG